MILRFQTSDNADAWYVSKFCEGLRDRMFTKTEDLPERSNYDSDEKWSDDVIQYWKEEKELKNKRHLLMDPKKHFSKNSKAYKEIVAEAIRQWNEYARPRNLMYATPDISIRYSIEEYDENGEVIYYFTALDQIINC